MNNPIGPQGTFAPVATTTWEVWSTTACVGTCSSEHLGAARAAVERELVAIDRACSRFREDSELSRLNARAGISVEVGGLLFEAMTLALRAAALTDGDVDPTLGAALELVGYDRDLSALIPAGTPAGALAAAGPAPAPAAPARPRVVARRRAGWQAIELDATRRTAKIPRGVRLDLGATAKALASDRAAQAASREVGTGVVVALGGDVAVSGEPPIGGWRVRVTDDHRLPDGPGQGVAISEGGLATSSTTVRRWQHRGRTMHHILDPATGQPAAEVWRTVSVAAATCVDANAASTAALVRGARAPAWLTQARLPARLVGADGRVTAVGGWPAQDVQTGLEGP